jgi:hypothetical protein
MTRDEAYQNLSELIFKGFLTLRVNLEDKFFVFKTINEKEYEFIRLCSGSPKDGDAYKARFNLYFLVFSLFMIDGDNVLIGRNERISEFFKFFSNIPKDLCTRMIQEVNGLWAQSYDSLKFLEGFTYTHGSRRIWKVLRDNNPNLSEFTGISGTDSLGLNAHQENWIYINRIMDDEESYEKDFSLSVLVASASNPKGSKQIRAKHDTQAKAMEEKRLKLAEVGHVDKTGWKPEGWAVPVDTAEDLVAELERQMHGIKDKHDVFMENYIKKMRENADSRSQEAKQKVEEYRKKVGNEYIAPISGSQRALTAEETRDMMKRSVKKNFVAVVEDDEKAGPEDKERYLNKVGNKILTAKK